MKASLHLMMTEQVTEKKSRKKSLPAHNSVSLRRLSLSKVQSCCQ